MSGPLPDHAARELALDLSHHVLAVAPAGSGKTGLLVQRLLRALAIVDEPEQVVAITFTNKAAAEIRARVITALLRAREGGTAANPHEALTQGLAAAALARSQARGWDLPAHPTRLRALTIDSFNAQFAAQLPLLSGLGGPASVSDDEYALYLEAVAGLFARLEDRELDADDRAALEDVLRLADNRLDRLIDPLSELLSKREQWLPQLARADDAAWEQQENAALSGLVESRLRALDAMVPASIKQALTELLRQGSGVAEKLSWAAGLDHWPTPAAEQLALYRHLAEVLVTRQGVLRKAQGVNAGFGFPPKAGHTARMKALLLDLEGQTELAGCCAAILPLPEVTYPAQLRQLQRHLLRVLRLLAAHLRLVISERGQADFTEVALSARAALRPDGGYSEALLAADRHIRHLLVDEMQDTSEGQVELLRLLTLGWEPGDGRSLFLVGDPQQSIYAFRKAEVRLFLELLAARRLGSLPLECVQLTANFRSQPALVDWFNASFHGIFPPHSDPWSGVVAYTPSVAAGGTEGSAAAQIYLLDSNDAELEGEQVARCAQTLTAHYPGASIAVLARSRPHLGSSLRWLRRLQVPYACQDVDPLAALPAVRDYLHLARALWHPQDRLAWAVLLRSPMVGLSWADLVALARGRTQLPWPGRLEHVATESTLSAEGQARVARLRVALAAVEADADLRASLAERAEALWHVLGGPGCVTLDELRDVRTAMHLLRKETRGGEFEDIEGFTRRLTELYGAASGGQVQVLTIHKAKGLEFDHVLIAGCGRRAGGSEKPLLHFRGTQAGELLVPKPPESLAEADPAWRLYDYLHTLHTDGLHNELLRLLYVATTRARRTLHLFVGMDRDRKSGELKPRAGTFAELLEPVLPSQAVTPAVPRTQDTAVLMMPRAPRLPVDFHFEIKSDPYRPRERRTLKPSEAVLAAHEDKREEESEVYARLIGTLYHEAAQKIARDGLELWADAGASHRASLVAGLRRLGMPGPLVAPAVERVLALLRSTLAGKTGRWLLSPKPWARSEYHLAGYLDGHWVSALIDRCFEEGDGTLWVVDYKTAAQALAGDPLETFIQTARARYRGQLELYARLLQAQRGAQGVRAALYFPDADRLIEPLSAA